MDTTEPKPDVERDQLVKMLGTLYKTAEHASLTGAFRKGGAEAVGYYNRVLARFTERGDVSPTLFPPLEPTASFDEVGIAAKLLAGYLYVEQPEKKREVRLDFEGLSHLGEVGKRIRDEFRGRGGRGGVRISFGDELEDREAEDAEEAQAAEEAEEA
jgi:hypothetical protein